MQFLLPVSPAAAPNPDWWLADRIAHGDSLAVEELYHLIQQMLRPGVLYRVRETDPHDLLHETLTIIVESIRNGHLRNPGALRAYSQAVLRRQVAGQIVRAVWNRRRMVDDGIALESAQSKDNPEKAAIDHERSELITRGLKRLGTRDNELMTRFYIRGEDCILICIEMNLSETQFRLFKSRAKAKLTVWARSAMVADQRVLARA